MAQHFDTFLPSGAILDDERAPAHGIPSDSIASTQSLPRHIPASLEDRDPNAYSISSTYQSLPRISSQPRISSKSQNGKPISPPVTRSPSADETIAGLLEDWREYTRNLRDQFEAEREHMAADRVRMEEIMSKERTLWDKERVCLKGLIKELEERLVACSGSQLPKATSPLQGNTPRNGTQSAQAHTGSPRHSARSQEVLRPVKLVRQESGRNPDGSPFYAPASQNVSRTFEATQNGELRVDSIAAPMDAPFRVTSRELTQSDFGVQTPPHVDTGSRDGCVLGDSIDIFHIHRDLDGVPIKASAVSPTFVAKVLSPNSSLSPKNRSPNILHPPPRPHGTTGSHEGSPVNISTLEVMNAPENRRLTMNAGHTPTHSMTKFDFGDSGNATPTQSQIKLVDNSEAVQLVTTTHQTDGTFDPDPELSGPLGLENDLPKDALFLAALTSKLEEVKENASLSPTESSVVDEELLKSALTILGRKGSGSADTDDGSDDEPEEEIPRLRVKQSSNFGRPFGSL